MTNKRKTYLQAVVVVIGILYLVLAFTNWSYNPSEWGGFSRFLFIGGSVLAVFKMMN